LRFSVQPRDVPCDVAARRLGKSRAEFESALPNLVARGFPRPDPDTGNFDLTAIDRWCDARHPHLFSLTVQPTARDAQAVVGSRLARMRGD
jgi:hypothetical protein